MDKFLKKATSNIPEENKGKFEKYNLAENPFPSTPIVNKDSTEKKFNGSIYENTIRDDEHNKMVRNFLEKPQNDINHLRLGFIIDSSYIGRGNGKSAFLVNLMKEINENYCLNFSNEQNKCFATYFAPEGGGNTKTFEKFTDIFFQSILNSNIINFSLATLRLEALLVLKPTKINFEIELQNEADILNKLNSEDFFNGRIIKTDLLDEMRKNKYISKLPKEFPLFNNQTNFLTKIVSQTDFEEYYKTLRKDKEKYDFIFTDLINFFLAASFNGSYIFVDDFERIPDFQSAVQKKDFAIQLRTILYDGLYLNSKIGFYNFVFALHAGVPRLMQDAWGLAGLEQRIAITPSNQSNHIITFDKINEKHAVLLIKKYLTEYRILNTGDDLFPFTEESIKYMGVISEMNASKILQLANNIINYAAEKNVELIDTDFVQTFTNSNSSIEPNFDGVGKKDISSTNTIDLINKADTK